jgi:hypothetical protein
VPWCACVRISGCKKEERRFGCGPGRGTEKAARAEKRGGAAAAAAALSGQCVVPRGLCCGIGTDAAPRKGRLRTEDINRGWAERRRRRGGERGRRVFERVPSDSVLLALLSSAQRARGARRVSSQRLFEEHHREGIGVDRARVKQKRKSEKGRKEAAALFRSCCVSRARAQREARMRT